MRTRDLEAITNLLSTAIERTALAIGEAVRVALTPPKFSDGEDGRISPASPSGLDGGGVVMTDAEVRALAEELADPTDGVEWLMQREMGPSAGMGPAGANPLRG